MSTTSKIEWTDKTWNPVRGCSLVSAGCANCYAMKLAHRFSGTGKPYEGLTELGPHGPRWTGKITLVPGALDEPLRWKKPQKIFVNSMSDLFHEGVPYSFIERVFATMFNAKWHTFQILTKRPKRMKEFMEAYTASIAPHWQQFLPLKNVWLGVSIEDQKTADERIPLLLETPAAVRFVSYEPALGPVGLRLMARSHGFPKHITRDGRAIGMPQGLHWVIVGGESGPGARPMHPDWARSIRDQCQAAGAPFFFKQWGEWKPPLPGEAFNTIDGRSGKPPAFLIDHHGHVHCTREAAGAEAVPVIRVGKKAAGALLDGREWREFPR